MIKLLLCWSRKNYIKSDGALIGSQYSVYSVCGSFSEVVQLLGRIPVLPCLNADSSATSQTLLSWISAQVITAATHTHTHTFNGPFSGTTQVSRYQKDKTKLDFTEARDSEWQWHQLGRMQVCTSLQTDNHASTSPLSFLQAGCPSCRPTNSVKH